MNERMRLLIAVALLTALSSASAGWIEERGDQTIIHVTIWSLPPEHGKDAAHKVWRLPIDQFKENFPQIFAARYRDKYLAAPERYGRRNWDRIGVEFHPFRNVGVRGMENPLVEIEQRRAPDVLYVNFRRSDGLIRHRMLYPLDQPEDEYLTSMNNDELAMRVHPTVWPVIRRKGPDGKVAVWALPHAGQPLGKVLQFRKEIFARMELTYPDAEWTWEQLLEACKHISHRGDGTIPLIIPRSDSESWFWLDFFWSSGAELTHHDPATGQRKWTFDSREAARSLEFYLRLCAEPWTDAEGQQRYGYVERQWGRTDDPWGRGQQAMSVSYFGEEAFNLKRKKIGVAPLPLGPAGLRGGELNSRMMGLFRDISDPAVRDTAWEYIRFYGSHEALRSRVGYLVEHGVGLDVNPVYLRMFGHDKLADALPPDVALCWKLTVETGRPEPYWTNSTFIYQILSGAIHEAEQLLWDGKLPQDAEQRIDALQELLRRTAAHANEVMPPSDLAAP